MRWRTRVSCPPDLILRPYGDSDFPAVASIWDDGMRRAHPFLPDGFVASERAALGSLYLKRTRTDVAVLKSVVGFVSVLDGTEIAALFVDPGHQRMGIGRRLLDAARPEGRTTVEVLERNLNARAFYHRYGFRPAGQRQHPETGMTLLRLAIG